MDYSTFCDNLYTCSKYIKADSEIIEKAIQELDFDEIDIDTVESTWPLWKQHLMEALVETIATKVPSITKESWQSQSPIDFCEHMEKTTDIDLSKTSFLQQIIDNPLNSSKKSKKRSKPIDNNRPGASYTTQKRNKKDTSTSSIGAYTTVRTADAQLFEDSDSNEGNLDTRLCLIQPTISNSGLTGSSIFLKNQGKSYTWKLPAWTTATKYIDLKVYNNPQDLVSKKPMDFWREAGLRAKVQIGTQTSNPERTIRINRLLERLTTLLIDEVQSAADCKASCHE